MASTRSSPTKATASAARQEPAAWRRSDDAIELDTSPPSRSSSPPLRKVVSFGTPHTLQDYGSTSTPRRSLDDDGSHPVASSADAAAGQRRGGSDRDDSGGDDDDDDETANERSLLAELAELETADLAALEPSRNERWERAFALLVACLLSVGSHYGSYLLGPIKNRIQREMGTSNTQFSLLLAALSLNNTWTPLVGGLLTAKIGTPRASILATGIIFLGQLLVLISTGAGNSEEQGSQGNIKGMAAGLFIFGMGVSPLAVVQETIIVRYFSNHGLGVSLALGLVAGKGASFLSSITSYPLSDRYGTRGPFVVSTGLAGLSFAVNILYLIFHARLHPAASSSDSSHKSDEVAAERVIQRRKVKLMNLSKLGDVFWIYIVSAMSFVLSQLGVPTDSSAPAWNVLQLMNVFSGAIWSPFLHLSSNIVQRRFQLADDKAASYASLLLAGAIFLYPLAGFIHDLAHSRHPTAVGPGQVQSSTIVYRLLTLASLLTLFCFGWLALPAEWTNSPVPALVSFGIGHGFATLLLVLVVPGIVAPEWVSTALGTHKSMESAATTFAQTLSGLLLDKVSKKKGSPAGVEMMAARKKHPIPPSTRGTWLLIAAFLAINVLQLLSILALWRAFSRRCARQAATADEGAYAALPKAGDEAVVDGSGEDEPGHALQTPNEEGEARANRLHQPSSRTFSTSSRRPLLWSETASTLSSVGSVEAAGGTRSTLLVVDPRDCSEAEIQRGRWFFGASISFLLLVWATFGAVSLFKG